MSPELQVPSGSGLPRRSSIDLSPTSASALARPTSGAPEQDAPKPTESTQLSSATGTKPLSDDRDKTIDAAPGEVGSSETEGGYREPGPGTVESGRVDSGDVDSGNGEPTAGGESALSQEEALTIERMTGDGSFWRRDPRSVFDAALDALWLHQSRLAVTVAVVAMAALAGWWVLRPAPNAPVAESAVPLTAGAGSDADDAAGSANSSPAADNGGASGGASEDNSDGSPRSGSDQTVGSTSEPAGTGTGAVSGTSADVEGEPGESAAGRVVVHLTGAVARPGVFELDVGSRVIDAVTVAGGPTEVADLARVNLAARLVDGSRVYLPTLGESEVPAVVPPTPDRNSGVGGVAGEASVQPEMVDINLASEVELQKLPGVGPSIAAAIVATRDQLGGFPTVDALLEVPGIGTAKLDRLRPQVLAIN